MNTMAKTTTGKPIAQLDKLIHLVDIDRLDRDPIRMLV